MELVSLSGISGLALRVRQGRELWQQMADSGRNSGEPTSSTANSSTAKELEMGLDTFPRDIVVPGRPYLLSLCKQHHQPRNQVFKCLRIWSVSYSTQCKVSGDLVCSCLRTPVLRVKGGGESL